MPIWVPPGRKVGGEVGELEGWVAPPAGTMRGRLVGTGGYRRKVSLRMAVRVLRGLVESKVMSASEVKELVSSWWSWVSQWGWVVR